MSDDAIVPANIRALGAIYFSAMLDASKAYDVADRLVELYRSGLLPVGRSGAHTLLDRYWRDANERISSVERRSVYAQALGVPGGDPDGSPNRDFNDLWVRFVSSVAGVARQDAAGTGQGANTPDGSSQDQVRMTARDIALNVSRHGADLVAMAAAINAQRVEMLSVLADQDIQRAYGVRGVWRLVEHVASLELGGPATTTQRVAMAESGAIVFAWLASRSPAFWTAAGDALDLSERRADSPTTNPIDFDLVNACEQWLAASAAGDSHGEELSQPRQTVEVRDAVGSLLSRSAAFASLAPAIQAHVAHDTIRIADYLATRDQSAEFGSLVAAVDFPGFVADLIDGVFDAVVNTSIRQMEAYAALIAGVAASLDEFTDERVSDAEARERLCERFPALCEASGGVGERPAPRTRGADRDRRRRPATTRQQLLATMVTMGLHRIAASG